MGIRGHDTRADVWWIGEAQIPPDKRVRYPTMTTTARKSR
jgi:hypothetical protein